MNHVRSSVGASVPDQALAVPVEPEDRLDPTGFDPSREEAARLCEQFIGQVLIVRAISETVERNAVWQRLKHTPVRSIDGVDGCATEEYAVDIDSSGDGWIRFTSPADGSPAEVRCCIGMASSVGDVPMPLLAGIDRMATHLANSPNEPPPAAVTALWRPYRRLRLS